MSLIYIGQQFTVYCGYCLLIIGVFGNALNVWIFSSVRTYYTTPCTLYFLISSTLNIVYITINLIQRILSVGYGIDPTQTSNVWCKIRQFLLVTPCIISTTCSCLSAIDQYLVTSRHASFRRLSNIKMAHRLIFITVIVWCLHGIPILLFYHISSTTKTCANQNDEFAVYISVYLLGFICFIPTTTMSLFGWLTYRNICQTIALTKRNMDRQIMRMTLNEIGLFIISLIPYSIYIAYTFITSGITKPEEQQIKEYFVYTILSMMTYLFYTGSFYVFFISSNRFRREVKDRLLGRLQTNQINPH